MNLVNIVFIIEIIGVISFAISGVMVAYEKKMDVFGAVVLGCSTAVCGGMTRDIILGITPPTIFIEPIYIIVAAITSLVTFVYKYNKSKTISISSEKSDLLLSISDSVGLAVFVVTGCDTAISHGYGNHVFLCIFVGVITGIGGGILRDVLADQMPLIMRKRVYGLAAIIGAIIYCECLIYGVDDIVASATSIAVICIIRFLAIRYKWNLPKFE